MLFEDLSTSAELQRDAGHFPAEPFRLFAASFEEQLHLSNPGTRQLELRVKPFALALYIFGLVSEPSQSILETSDAIPDRVQLDICRDGFRVHRNTERQDHEDECLPHGSLLYRPNADQES
jgi:hypothetical protein